MSEKTAIWNDYGLPWASCPFCKSEHIVETWRQCGIDKSGNLVEPYHCECCEAVWYEGMANVRRKKK